METTSLKGMICIAVGQTGAGKSHILNQIHGQASFKEGDKLVSETSKYILKKVVLVGDINNNTTTLIDTPGYGDNRSIIPDQIEQICTFLKNIKSGFNIVLFVIDLGQRKLNVESFKIFVSE